MRHFFIIALCLLGLAAAAAAWFYAPSDPVTACARHNEARRLASGLTDFASGAPRAGAIGSRDWCLFKSRFIRDDGQLVDSYSQVSHSEGQGYALLLALAADDRAVFDRVWNWTRVNLRRGDDALLAWKWKPNGHGGGAVGDANDAADGDILVAWALHRAARQWQEPRYDAAARPIAEDVLRKLVRQVGGFTVLLPGLSGFEHKDGVTINLSYWIFPAFRSLNQVAPSPAWRALDRSGLYLVGAARFGPERLPSDWMTLSPAASGISIALPKDRPLYGFDATRIPLYLLWDGKASPQNLAPFLDFWRRRGEAGIPATINLATGAPGPYPLSPGMRAIAAAVANRCAEPACAVGDGPGPALPPLEADRDYYSSALGLLVRLALNETS